MKSVLILVIVNVFCFEYTFNKQKGKFRTKCNTTSSGTKTFVESYESKNEKPHKKPKNDYHQKWGFLNNYKIKLRQKMNSFYSRESAGSNKRKIGSQRRSVIDHDVEAEVELWKKMQFWLESYISYQLINERYIVTINNSTKTQNGRNYMLLLIRINKAKYSQRKHKMQLGQSYISRCKKLKGGTFDHNVKDLEPKR